MSKKHIELHDAFKTALLEMEETNNHIFLTGKAGTGKSTLLEHFREHTKKKVVVLAPTGVAAINVKGQTIHSFFRFGISITPDSVTRLRLKENVYEKLETIVIDEVSMVRADLMDCIDRFMRLHKDKDKPFGGVQLICIGDLYQLPPVVSHDDVSGFFDMYTSPYFFDSYAFSSLPYKVVELDKIFRQKDQDFIHVLNAIRDGSVTDDMLSLINTRYQKDFSLHPDETYIYVTTTNKKADDINGQKLSQIKGREYTYKGEILGEFNEKDLPVQKDLVLKKGAQVMMLINDSNGRWVNGTLAKVAKISDEKIVVELPNGKKEEVDQYTWEKYKYTFDEESGKVKAETVGTFTQYPLKLAWAITIHKSQGKTFEKVIIDFGFGTFAHGQAYVALSRCTSLEGIILTRKISKRDVLVEERVVDFMA